MRLFLKLTNLTRGLISALSLFAFSFAYKAFAYAPPIPNQQAIPVTNVTNINDFYLAICAVTQWMLVFGIVIGVLFIIYGGVRYITSGGDSAKSSEAKSTILTALLGVVFLILAMAIVRIVASFFSGAGFGSLLIC